MFGTQTELSRTTTSSLSEQLLAAFLTPGLEPPPTLLSAACHAVSAAVLHAKNSSSPQAAATHQDSSTQTTPTPEQSHKKATADLDPEATLSTDAAAWYSAVFGKVRVTHDSVEGRLPLWLCRDKHGMAKGVAVEGVAVAVAEVEDDKGVVLHARLPRGAIPLWRVVQATRPSVAVAMGYVANVAHELRLLSAHHAGCIPCDLGDVSPTPTSHQGLLQGALLFVADGCCHVALHTTPEWWFAATGTRAPTPAAAVRLLAHLALSLLGAQDISAIHDSALASFLAAANSPSEDARPSLDRFAQYAYLASPLSQPSPRPRPKQLQNARYSLLSLSDDGSVRAWRACRSGVEADVVHSSNGVGGADGLGRVAGMARVGENGVVLCGSGKELALWAPSSATIVHASTGIPNAFRVTECGPRNSGVVAVGTRDGSLYVADLNQAISVLSRQTQPNRFQGFNGTERKSEALVNTLVSTANEVGSVVGSIRNAAIGAICRVAPENGTIAHSGGEGGCTIFVRSVSDIRDTSIAARLGHKKPVLGLCMLNDPCIAKNSAEIQTNSASHGPHLLVSCGADGRIHIWDLRSPPTAPAMATCTPSRAPVRAILPLCPSAKVGQTACGPNILASADDLGIICIWDVRFFPSIRPVAQLSAHRGSVHALAYYDPGNLSEGDYKGAADSASMSSSTVFDHPALFSAGQDTVVRSWKPPSLRPGPVLHAHIDIIWGLLPLQFDRLDSV
eukprot:TRINITY_DN11206_c0_g1_i1.p1 TRINITY_DN11206_c0_g1~~TRINITY_DN11206_c0_g1_i1.p1  ORF type:complete len:758 (+),score=112.54 TRINITY_DN11206_c0_g1_i1:78-2276(+)